MKLQAMNKKITDYGYDYEIEYGNPEFHGHVKGVELCVIDARTGYVTENHLPNSVKENRDEVLDKILNDDSIIKVVNNALIATESGGLVPEDIYMLPYMVIDHSCLQPTANFVSVVPETMLDPSDLQYCMDIEVLFCCNNLNRYMTLHLQSHATPVIDLVLYVFSSDNDDLDEFLKNATDIKLTPTENHEHAVTLDMYNECGDRFDIKFPSIDHLADRITSIRLLDCKPLTTSTPAEDD